MVVFTCQRADRASPVRRALLRGRCLSSLWPEGTPPLGWEQQEKMRVMHFCFKAACEAAPALFDLTGLRAL